MASRARYVGEGAHEPQTRQKRVHEAGQEEDEENAEALPNSCTVTRELLETERCRLQNHECRREVGDPPRQRLRPPLVKPPINPACQDRGADCQGESEAHAVPARALTDERALRAAAATDAAAAANRRARRGDGSTRLACRGTSLSEAIGFLLDMVPHARPDIRGLLEALACFRGTSHSRPSLCGC